MTDSDGRLAPVTYLFGTRAPAESAPPVPAARPDSASDPADGWYVEPGAVTPAADADADADADVSPVRRLPVFVETAAFLEDAAARHAHPAATRTKRDRRLEQEAEASDSDVPETAAELAARAESISMSALTRKGMSSWEMADRLRSKDLDADTVATEVARLERVGLLDDLDLAQNLIRTLQDRKGLGRSGITAELRRRHVDPDAIEQALAELDGDDETTRATEIAIKRAPQLRSLDSTTAKRRLSAFLMRKGYSGAAISAAVAAALEPSGPRFR